MSTSKARSSTLLCIGSLGLLCSLALGPAEQAEQPPVTPPTTTAAEPRPMLAVITIHDDMIDDVTTSSLKRRTEEAIKAGAKTIVLELNTPGGMVSSSVDIAKYIRNLSENQGIRVIAWVRDEAISGGTLIAMACDEIITSRSATIGDCGVILMGPTGASTAQDPALDAKIESYVLATFDEAATRNGYDPLLCDAFVRHEVEVWWIENVATHERRFVNRQEKEKLVDKPVDAAQTSDEAGTWRLVETYIDPKDHAEKKLRQPVDADNELLTMDQSRAIVLGFSKGMIRDETELRAHCGLAPGAQLLRLEQTWSELLVSWLTSPVVRMFLIAMIGLGAYVEFQSPGLGLPGLVAVMALAVFLGAPYLTGLANFWEIVIVLAGFALIMVEIFVLPGFGVAGITGMMLLLIGLLATFMPEEPGRAPIYWPDLPQTFEGLKRGVVSLAGGLGMLVAGAVALSKYMQHIPYLRDIIPPNPTVEAVTPDDPYDGLVQLGDVGRTEGPLRPSGKARFGSRLVDVISEGDMLDPGTTVEVIERRGNRVVVRRSS